MPRAHDIAKFLLSLSHQEQEAEPMTNLRLQKLVYYVQGWALAMRDQPIIEEDIQAWREGPVVPSLWSTLTKFGGQPIPPDALQEAKELTADDQEFVRSIWEGYKQYSAVGLSQKTHDESPWKSTFSPDSNGRCKFTIQPEAMKNFFQDFYDQVRIRPSPSLDRFRSAENHFAKGKCHTFEEVFAV